MLRAQIRRRVPRPVKQAVAWVRGWGFTLRRSLSARAPSPSPSPRTDGLPEGAPDSLLARNEHGSYCVPRSSQHRPIARAILESRVWEAETLELLRSVDPAADIVHAGTFFGDFLPALARSRSEGALVWAFEPGRENFECSRVTIALNGLENVRLSNVGLSSSGGRARLATSDRSGVPLGGGSRVVRDRARARWLENEKIELVTLDEAIGEDRNVAALQLDVEGHEQEALAGALRTIARCRPLIVLETPPAPAWIEEHLGGFGYRVEGKVNINIVLRAS